MDKILLKEELKKVVSKETSLKEIEKGRIWERLEETLKSCPNGLGLAAIQIGVPIRAFIIRNQGIITNCFNPIILSETNYALITESCLSFPGEFIQTRRATKIEVRYFDRLGVEKECTFKNYHALVFQHELDHLNGLTMFDRKWEEKPKVDRNAPCPCGSLKKYKKCCGR